MGNAAIIDDDPVELTILSGLAQSLDQDWNFTRFPTIDAFLTSMDTAGFEVLFLDRRVPPHDCFEPSLAMIERSDFKGHVVLLTNHRLGGRPPASTLKLLGPYEKLDIQEPNVLEALLNGHHITC